MSEREEQPRLTIDTDDPVDRWRYRCPRGHSQYEPTNHHWYCVRCANRHDNVDPEFTELVDKQTGQVFERHEVNIKGYRSKTA